MDRTKIIPVVRTINYDYFHLRSCGKLSIVAISRIERYGKTQRRHTVFLGTIEEGQCFGEMSYIRGQQTPRTATVISDREVIVIKINAENLKQTSERVRNLFNMVLLNVLANRLERTSIMASMI